MIYLKGRNCLRKYARKKFCWMRGLEWPLFCGINFCECWNYSKKNFTHNKVCNKQKISFMKQLAFKLWAIQLNWTIQLIISLLHKRLIASIFYNILITPKFLRVLKTKIVRNKFERFFDLFPEFRKNLFHTLSFVTSSFLKVIKTNLS